RGALAPDELCGVIPVKPKVEGCDGSVGNTAAKFCREYPTRASLNVVGEKVWLKATVICLVWLSSVSPNPGRLAPRNGSVKLSGKRSRAAEPQIVLLGLKVWSMRK